MSISKDLFLSILAMDAYNRGYAPGIEQLGGFGAGVGSATIRADNLPAGSQAAGFYAIAYNDPTYGTIISYRGTDDENYLTGELPTVDLPISFGGSYNQTQIALAQTFFDAVDNLNGTSAILLTCHSLSGALACRARRAVRRGAARRAQGRFQRSFGTPSASTAASTTP